MGGSTVYIILNMLANWLVHVRHYLPMLFLSPNMVLQPLQGVERGIKGVCHNKFTMTVPALSLQCQQKHHFLLLYNSGITTA